MELTGYVGLIFGPGYPQDGLEDVPWDCHLHVVKLNELLHTPANFPIAQAR